jgi:tetratricopeptide (TPR) repeat protein
MDTLYDLLGALPHDDAEGLRTAFRRAVKATHPDLRPGDPDAALKFRQIVRANEILGDAEERATYDHLLELARLEQVSESKHAFAATIYKLASAVIALAASSVVIVGGYLLFIHISAGSVDPASEADVAVLASQEVAPAAPAVMADISGPALRPESAIIIRQPIAPTPVPIRPKAAESSPAGSLGPVSDRAAREARALRARGISAYRNGDLNGAIADLDQALQLDPKYLTAYIDRSIIFYRQRKFDRAFADLAPAKRLERSGHPKPPMPIIRKPHIDQADISPSVTSWSQRFTAAQDPSRGEGFGSVMR